MIKFFRHIRQNQIMENKTGKYFKYAIGEIILVVTGILIAVSINNWSESNKQKQELNNIYTNVLEDLNADISHVDAIIKGYMSRGFTIS
ncbi:MAG: sensor domain CHASE-containing protein [Psychroserpens sp.]|jgi:sensor domain CHASE-containing protein